MKQIKVTATVPMKGNSERVPNKNIRLLNGKPVCHWIIESLSKSKYVDEILINTDSEKIKEIVSGFDMVKILDRPDFLLGDTVSMQPLLAYDIEHAKNEHIFQTHSTNPLLSTETIDRAIETYFSKLDTNDALFSVTPIQQRFYFKNGKAVNHDPHNMIQTQLLEPIYHENSCLYIFSRETNRNVKNRNGKNPYFFEMDHLEATDIDEWHDFLWAEFLMNQKTIK
ncbi:MAG: CMP-N-acetylneuraminic acid synthetase [Flavobacteriales bacterium]|jgi:CMP-N-acetylneuraminic acid synthetase